MQYRFAVNLRTLSTLVCNDLANERVERAAVITRRIHRQLSNDITLLPLFIVEGFPGGFVYHTRPWTVCYYYRSMVTTICAAFYVFLKTYWVSQTSSEQGCGSG